MQTRMIIAILTMRTLTAHSEARGVSFAVAKAHDEKCSAHEKETKRKTHPAGDRGVSRGAACPAAPRERGEKRGCPTYSVRNYEK